MQQSLDFVQDVFLALSDVPLSRSDRPLDLCLDFHVLLHCLLPFLHDEKHVSRIPLRLDGVILLVVSLDHQVSQIEDLVAVPALAEVRSSQKLQNLHFFSLHQRRQYVLLVVSSQGERNHFGVCFNGGISGFLSLQGHLPHDSIFA